MSKEVLICIDCKAGFVVEQGSGDVCSGCLARRRRLAEYVEYFVKETEEPI